MSREACIGMLLYLLQMFCCSASSNCMRVQLERKQPLRVGLRKPLEQRALADLQHANGRANTSFQVTLSISQTTPCCYAEMAPRVTYALQTRMDNGSSSMSTLLCMTLPSLSYMISKLLAQSFAAHTALASRREQAS